MRDIFIVILLLIGLSNVLSAQDRVNKNSQYLSFRIHDGYNLTYEYLFVNRIAIGGLLGYEQYFDFRDQFINGGLFSKFYLFDHKITPLFELGWRRKWDVSTFEYRSYSIGYHSFDLLIGISTPSWIKDRVGFEILGGLEHRIYDYKYKDNILFPLTTIRITYRIK